MEEAFDFVVVGSGGGSMCAALYLRTLGKSVLILEKTDKVGGTTATAGGVMWVPNNRFMAEEGVPDSVEAATRYLDNVVGDHNDTPGATRERRSTYLAQAPEMVDFLVSQGIKLRRSPYWPDYFDEMPGGSEAGRTVVAELFDANELGPWRAKLRTAFMEIPATLEEAGKLGTFPYSWPGKRMLAKVIGRGILAKLTGKHWVSAGNALQGRMLQAALRAGVDIRLDTPVTGLVEHDGRVTGVVANGRRIGARLGVLLNAGGFARNQRMRDTYIPGTSATWTNACPGDTGEMIEEAQRMGAAVAQMNERAGCQMAFPPDHKSVFQPMIQHDLAKPHAILVDQTGQRYMNEGGSYSAFCNNMMRRHKEVPAVPSWMVFDSQFIRRYMVFGTMPGANKPRAWFESGFLKMAKTLPELAKLCAMAPGNLEATIVRFNGFVDRGRDEDFHRGDRAYDKWLGDPYHKPSPTLGTIEQGPFYAVQIFPGDIGTFGGVVTDCDARVLREDGTPIAGLYATGTTTAAVMGRTYPGAGCSIGPSFTWGYLAAKHAASANS